MLHSGIFSTSTRIRIAARCIAVGVCITALLGAGAALVGTTTANAKPEFAAQTKLPCGQCHTTASGGGKLKAFGEKFKANGYKVK
jgi:hypothetical protein